jgi:hypothetical protein
MRFFRGLAEGKGYSDESAPIAPFRAAAWVSCTLWIIGALKNKSVPFTGVLTRSEAHSLDKAILVVGLPPIFFFIAIAWFVYRRRQTWRAEAAGKLPSDRDSS